MMMKKYVIFALGMLMGTQAQAVCSGGFDGRGGMDSGCSEMGALGELIYKRDDAGRVLRKRNDAEIKDYLVTTVEKRLERRGITMKDKNGAPVIKIDRDTVTFDLFNQNGEKIYTYTVDVAKGVPQNEKDIIAARESYDAQKARAKADRLDRIAKVQALGDKIKAEEIDGKAAAKK